MFTWSKTAMSAKRKVLVVGASGMLGYEITQALASHGDQLEVTALVRADRMGNPHTQEKFTKLQRLGVKFVDGDLLAPETLASACWGVDTIVSAVSGDERVMIEGQTNLIHAAEAAGVRRFIPSDYSVDYRNLDRGDNYNLDFRKTILELLQRQSNLSYTSVQVGILTEILFSPFGVVFDLQKGQFRYWGDGETAFDTTTIVDAARYTAEAVLDDSLINQVLQVAGDTLTMKQLRALYEQNTIQVLREKRLGDVNDLQMWIAGHKEQAKSVYEYLSQQYHYTLVSGKGKLTAIANDRYPHIKPTTVKEYIRDHYDTKILH